MKDEMFEELLQSVREEGAILRGKREPSRLPYYSHKRKANSGEDAPLAIGIRNDDGCQREDVAELVAGPAQANRSGCGIITHNCRQTEARA